MNLLDIYDEKYLNKAREDKELPTNHVDHHTQIWKKLEFSQTTCTASMDNFLQPEYFDFIVETT